MELKEIHMHLAAGTAAGKKSTCGTKIQHSTLEGAQRHADSLNSRPEVHSGEKNRQEPYPCPWCSPSILMGSYYWHVGREMTQAERDKWS